MQQRKIAQKYSKFQKLTVKNHFLERNPICLSYQLITPLCSADVIILQYQIVLSRLALEEHSSKQVNRAKTFQTSTRLIITSIAPHVK